MLLTAPRSKQSMMRDAKGDLLGKNVQAMTFHQVVAGSVYIRQVGISFTHAVVTSQVLAPHDFRQILLQ